MNDLTSVPETDLVWKESLFRRTVSYQSFVGYTFPNIDFRRIEARLTTYIKCKFIDCKFVNCNFVFSIFESCDFIFTDDTEIRDCSFFGARFSDCDFLGEGRIRYKHSNMRETIYERCKFNDIDMTSNGLEDSLFRSCRFNKLDLRSVSATALILDNTVIESLEISLENLSYIIGPRDFLGSVSSFEISSLNEPNDSQNIHSKEKLIEVLQNFINSENLDFFQKINLSIRISELEQSEINFAWIKDLLDRLQSQDLLYRLDQSINIIKSLRDNVKAKQILAPLLKDSLSISGNQEGKIPGVIFSRAKRAGAELEALYWGEVILHVRFGSANLASPEDWKKCAQIISAIDSCIKYQSIQSSEIYEGSIVFRRAMKLAYALRWAWVASSVLGASTIHLDINELLDQLSEMTTEVVDSLNYSTLEKLKDQAEELQLQIEIHNLRNREMKLIETSQIKFQINGEAYGLYENPGGTLELSETY